MFATALAATILTGCAVRGVHDGDTLTAWCPGYGVVKVRLYCIDAPELDQRPWGMASRDRLRELAGRGPVRILVRDIDRYGRLVGEVVRGRDVLNLRMVSTGGAAVYAAWCQDRRYAAAESDARRRKAGIWSKRGLHQRPWEWRRRHHRREPRPEWWRWLREVWPSQGLPVCH